DGKDGQSRDTWRINAHWVKDLINMKDENHTTALHMAIHSKNPQFYTGHLIRHGADPMVRNLSAGCTPFARCVTGKLFKSEADRLATAEMLIAYCPASAE